MIVLAFEEFAEHRRKQQVDIENNLRPLVRRALDGTLNTDGYGELIDMVRSIWRVVHTQQAGSTRGHIPGQFIDEILDTLRKTDRPSGNNTTINRISTWLATAILSHATLTAADDDQDDLLLEWVDMNDDHVRHEHHVANGQRVKPGEKFKVGGHDMPYPGYPGVPIELWINCRCTVRPIPAEQSIAASAFIITPIEGDFEAYCVHDGCHERGEYSVSSDHPAWYGIFCAEHAPEHEDKALFKDYSPEQRKKAHTLPDGSYPIEDCADLANAIQAIGRAKDPAKAKAHIRSRKNTLGCPDVQIPETWATYSTGPDWNHIYIGPERMTTTASGGIIKIDIPTWFTNQQETPSEGVTMTDETTPELEETEVEATDEGPGLIPWHGVITVEGVTSGDGRKFALGALRTRPLPLPMTHQKMSGDGHSQAAVVARIDRAVRVPVDGYNEIRANGVMLANPESDYAIGLMGEFGKFGVSVDADDATMEVDDEAEEMVFTDARQAGACIVPIPAFHQAYVQLGEAPEDFWDGGKDLETVHGEPDQALVAADAPVDVFVDIAPGKTEDGPGWLTHPVDTDRLRDYWVRGPGAAKIGWGTPGDFNRCRLNVAEYVKPQYINGYCANRHYDALGIWPGPDAHAADTLELTDRTPAQVLTVTAAGEYATKAPHEWFEMEEPDHVQPLTITEDGQVYGHVADWKTCHANSAAYGECFLAPRSPSGYAHFLLGEVLTDKGPLPIGRLTVGAGHANGRLGLRPATEHYDNASTVYAAVSCKDGEHGIWVCGWVPPGTPEDLVIAARACPPSGDWRKTPQGLDMIAAHSVVAPGYAIPRVAASMHDGEVISLVAAGAVEVEPEEHAAPVDVDALADAVVAKIAQAQERKEGFEALRARYSEEAV